MSWSTDTEGAYNFRVEIDSSIVVEPGNEVVVKFTGTVPAYVKNTGEENIAWNSFAYGYQNQMIMGDTYMVAEPAKVGVWVETPTAQNTITINKELNGATGGTFYFALFEVLGNEKYNRLSDVMPMTLGDTKSTGTLRCRIWIMHYWKQKRRIRQIALQFLKPISMAIFCWMEALLIR